MINSISSASERIEIPRPTSQFEARQLGRLRELKFLHAWRNNPHPPSWFVKVRDASKAEDRGDHTDAFIEATDRKIPIQIKGSHQAIEEFQGQFGQSHPEIVPVLVNELDPAYFIVRKTLQAIYKKHPDLDER